MEPVVGICSKCGSTLAADAPLGLCPKCLLAAAAPGADSLGLDTLGVSSALEAALAGESNPAETLSTAAADEVAGSHIGPYKLLQKIGEGGMGVVYMAEQERPVVRRVAIKIIKLGMDTKQVIARFEAERQALALMDHPNIARVLDAGATDMGRPYFVMELVRGVSITEYCDSNNLTTRQRLELFLPVCRAVQHAHQKGIIHRDLKPSNVLITMHDGEPVPKVIDFGVAKATSGRLTDKTLFTEYHHFIGTPQYMSPEQAEMSGLDIDTRADVYALGVLLYELLTGTTPFDENTLRRAAYAEIQRIIREVEPPKPSTRISTLGDTLTAVAAHRGTDPRKLSATMRGDLDWIVMKCLEKDRTRRYETANAVTRDVQRHLKDEPVEASPPSRTYRMRKFGRKYKKEVAALLAVIATLLLGIIGTTAGMLRARMLLHRAESAEKIVTELTPYSVGPQFKRARDLAAHGHFKEAEKEFADGLKIDGTDHEVWADSAVVALQVGNVAGYRRQCAEMLRRFGTSNDRSVCERIVKDCTFMPNAVPDLKPVMEMADRAVAPNDNDGLDMVSWRALAKGMAEYRAGNYSAASGWLQKALKDSNGLPDQEALLFLAMAEFKLGRRSEAERFFAGVNAGINWQINRYGLYGGTEGTDMVKDWIITLHVREEAAALLGHPVPQLPAQAQ